MWETLDGGIVRVPPCGPVVAGGALYFTNDGGSQLALSRVLDLSRIRYVIALGVHLDYITFHVVF